MVRPIFLVLAACGGSQSTIPNTSVPNTADNRDAITVVEEARVAIENKRWTRVGELASDDYKQCFREPGPCIRRSSVEEFLDDRFGKATLAYSQRYERVSRVGDKTFVDVTLDVQIEDPDGIWHIQAPHTFVVENATRRITSGLILPGQDPGPRDEAKSRATFDRRSR